MILQPGIGRDDDLARLREDEEDQVADQEREDRVSEMADHHAPGGWRPATCTCGHTSGDHRAVRSPTRTILGTCLLCPCSRFDDEAAA